MLLITLDMGVVARTADRVAVMYAGQIVEIGRVKDVFLRPQHPYTLGLMGSIPDIHAQSRWLEQIDGAMPSLNAFPPEVPCRRGEMLHRASALNADGYVSCTLLESLDYGRPRA